MGAGEAFSELQHPVRVLLMWKTGKVDSDAGSRSCEGVQRAVDYIDAHLGERLTLMTIAHEVSLSPFHFAHVFKRVIGIAPHQYVMQRRLERARQLLVHTDLPIVDIAVGLGYANQSHFSEQIHRETGVTPLNYRLHR